MKSWKTKSGYIIWKVLNLRCNAFILSNGKTNLLIDCGSRHFRRQLIWGLAKLGINHIDALILTHSHHDHAGNSHYIQNRFHTKVIIHERESEFLRTGYSPIPDGTNPLTRFLVRKIVPGFISRFSYLPCKANKTFAEHFSLQEYGFNAYILATPGHSVGSSSIVIDDEIVLAGDTIFGMFPGLILPPFADDALKMINSWKLLLETRASLFIPSHGQQRSRKLLEFHQKRTTDNNNTTIKQLNAKPKK
jgi:hydroxyacylglutathione hydrolase